MKSTNGGDAGKELRGDGLRIVLDLNDLKLKVLGDGCRVTVAKNCGSIRVVGDGCSLKVNCNDGDIEYKGDGGCIYLGIGSRTDSVTYVGDGGRITVGRNRERCKRRENTSGEGCVSDSELEMNSENATNETKERKETARKTLVANQQRAREFRRGGGTTTLRRSKTTIVTKMSSEEAPVIVNTKNHLVENWLRNPPSVIRTFKSIPKSL